MYNDLKMGWFYITGSCRRSSILLISLGAEDAVKDQGGGCDRLVSDRAFQFRMWKLFGWCEGMRTFRNFGFKHSPRRTKDLLKIFTGLSMIWMNPEFLVVL